MPKDLPDGKYLAEVIDHYLGETPKSHTPSIKFQFHVLSNLAHPKEPVDATIYGDLWLTDGAVDNTVETLYGALNWKGEKFTELDHTDVLVNQECILVIENETWEGKTRPKVQYINNVDYKPAGPSAENQKKIDLLNDRITNYRKANSITETQPAPAVLDPETSGTAVDDADLPF